jgi:hypothetical protein
MRTVLTLQQINLSRIFISILIAFLVMPVLAGEYKLLREGDPAEKAYFLDTTGVCTAMEQNLKKFRDRPYGMACKRELDPALGFTRPMWEGLDVMAHAALVQDIFRFEGWDKSRPLDGQSWEQRLRELVRMNGLVLELARIDLNYDGTPENLVRIGNDNRTCDSGEELAGTTGNHKSLVVADPTLTKVDPYSKYGVSLGVDDVFIYKGKVYTDVFYGMPLPARPQRKFDGELKIFEFSPKWVADICTFHYFDTTPSQGGK